MQISKLWLFSFLILTHCTHKKPSDLGENFLKSYPADEMKTVTLPKELNEISGLEWVGEEELWAIEDESGELFRIDPETGEILKKMKFGKNADFEDLAMSAGKGWILQSNGDLYGVADPFGTTSETVQFEFPNIGKRDMETVLLSENGKALWIICKECELDKGSQEASVFRFDLETLRFDPEPIHKLARKNFKNLPSNMNLKSLKLQPSAAALHPIEKKIYMISSSGGWLAILDLELNPLEIQGLDPKLFKQPEGIAFDSEGTLYISNEAAGGQSNLVIFPYNP